MLKLAQVFRRIQAGFQGEPICYWRHNLGSVMSKAARVEDGVVCYGYEADACTHLVRQAPNDRIHQAQQ